MNNGIIWPSEDEVSFYAWAGEQSSLYNVSVVPVAANDLWRFDVNGQGGGTWQSSSVPSNFVRTSSSQYTSAGDVGYVLGGYISDRTSPDNLLLGDWQMTPGMVSYDMTTGSWFNQSSCVGDSCYRDNGYMQHVDGFGSNGVIIALRGCTQTSPTYFGQCNATNPDALSNVRIYDPAQNKCFTQTAANVPPQLLAPRVDFCGVGVPGDNGTYEVFIFGGGAYSDSSNDDLTHLDEVYVLSLPAFAWFNADYLPVHTRTAHSCNVIGKRQMISLGGVNPAGNLWLPADPWTQSIGVFDMTEMKWTDGYNAAAEDYATPNVVKAWYAEKGQYPEWESTDVQALFVNKLTPTTSSPVGPAANSTSSDQSPSTPDESQRTRLIVGVTLGVVIAIALAAGLIYLFRRRLNSRRAASNTTATTTTTTTSASAKSLSSLYTKAELSSESSEKSLGYLYHSEPVEADSRCCGLEARPPRPPPKDHVEMEA